MTVGEGDTSYHFRRDTWSQDAFCVTVIITATDAESAHVDVFTLSHLSGEALLSASGDGIYGVTVAHCYGCVIHSPFELVGTGDVEVQ